MRWPVIPFDTSSQGTYRLPSQENTPARITIISHEPGEVSEKDVILSLEDTVTNELLDPQGSSKYSDQTMAVGSGYATELRLYLDLDQ
jgi:hypothetical protein